jgi:predicted RNase H-like HicB family nuclease
MLRKFTLEYWIDDSWYVGRLKEVPGVFSQGETIEELEDNIRDAYRLILKDEAIEPHPEAQTKEVGVEV